MAEHDDVTNENSNGSKVPFPPLKADADQSRSEDLDEGFHVAEHGEEEKVEICQDSAAQGEDEAGKISQQGLFADAEGDDEDDHLDYIEIHPHDTSRVAEDGSHYFAADDDEDEDDLEHADEVMMSAARVEVNSGDDDEIEIDEAQRVDDADFIEAKVPVKDYSASRYNDDDDFDQVELVLDPGHREFDEGTKKRGRKKTTAAKKKIAAKATKKVAAKATKKVAAKATKKVAAKAKKKVAAKKSSAKVTKKAKKKVAAKATKKVAPKAKKKVKAKVGRKATPAKKVAKKTVAAKAKVVKKKAAVKPVRKAKAAPKAAVRKKRVVKVVAKKKAGKKR